MAEERQKAPFELELDRRISAAQDNLKQAHTDLFPQEAADATEAPAEPAVPGTETPADQAAEGAKEVTPPAPTAQEETKAEAAPAEKPEKGESLNWKRLRDERREANRQIKTLQAELDALKAGKAAAPPASTQEPAIPAEIQDDPFGFKAEMNRLRAEIQQEQQKSEGQRVQERLTLEIATQENQFRQQNPQYDKARQHLIDTEAERYLLTGDANIKAKMLLDLSERFAGTRQDAKIVQDAIDRLVDERGMSEFEAARRIAADLHIATLRNQLIADHNNGLKIPERVWELATKYAGFTPEQVAAAAAPAPEPAKPAQTAAEQIRATARASAAGKSLSQLSPAGVQVEGGPAIRTVQDWMNFHKRDPQAARQFAMQMSQRDPNWHRNLQSR